MAEPHPWQPDAAPFVAQLLKHLDAGTLPSEVNPLPHVARGRGHGAARDASTLYAPHVLEECLAGAREESDTWRAKERRFGRSKAERAPLGVATTPEELRLAKEPNFAMRLLDKLEQRANRLSDDGPGSNRVGKCRPNAGRIVFTEVVRPHKKVAMAARVWVSEKGKTGTRSPTPHEMRMARVRAQPPIMMPRTKRNY